MKSIHCCECFEESTRACRRTVTVQLRELDMTWRDGKSRASRLPFLGVQEVWADGCLAVALEMFDFRNAWVTCATLMS